MNKHVIVACMPKSGSTFLSSAIAALPGYRTAILFQDWGRREQELDEKCLQNAVALGSFAAQCHLRYSHATQTLIDRYNLKTIVLVRNLFDVVPSFIDHHKKDSLVHPMAYVPEGIGDWRYEEQARFITKMIMPWYFNFYLSWRDVPNKILVRYDDWVTSPAATLSKICAYVGADVSDYDVVNAIESTVNSSHRKNHVSPGRGSQLPQACRDEIWQMAQFYKDVDFSPIGL